MLESKLTYDLDQVKQSFCISHLDCLGQLWDIQGAFEVTLDRYQYDDLNRLGYSLITETCIYCHEMKMIYLRFTGYKARELSYSYDPTVFNGKHSFKKV